jgi:hypothetical protein
MTISRRTALALFVAGSSFVPVGAQTAGGRSSLAADYRDIGWLALVPKDWRPQDLLDRKKAQSLNDGDALAQEMMRELREVLDSAPTVDELDQQAVKLPGYVVPLEQTEDGLSEFLLVPYYGACIHTPPPPANQIVHVVSAKPLKGFHAMAAVWVNGILRTARRDSGMGVSGYALELASMQAYSRK